MITNIISKSHAPLHIHYAIIVFCNYDSNERFYFTSNVPVRNAIQENHIIEHAIGQWRIKTGTWKNPKK